jgi:hypothetical protein
MQWDLGYLVNRDSLHAIGAALNVGLSAVHLSRFAVLARRRQWLPGGFTFDVGAGPLVHQVQVTPQVDESQFPTPQNVLAYGATVNAELGYRGHIGVWAGLDATHGGGRTGVGLQAGGRLGSYTGVAGTAAMAAFFAMIAYSITHGG